MGELYGLADLTVSPGNVGLTAVHSLSYGTPVITHNDVSNQGPEYEIIENGITGMFFERNNSESLAESICYWFQKNPDSSIKRQRCRINIDRFYNPDYQTAVFNELITGKKRLE
jgi:glycosyltransferase involved in cell wall biosynthesis